MIDKNFLLKLRALEPSDLDLLYEWENDRTIWQVSNTLAPFSRYVLKQYIENSHKDIYEIRQQRFMIDIFSGNYKKTVGAIDLFDFDPLNSRAGVGILIADTSDRKKGYAKKALIELIKYAFEILHLHQLYCNIASDNEASLILFRDMGFKDIGIKKQWLRTLHGFKDEVLLQLLNTGNL